MKMVRLEVNPDFDTSSPEAKAVYAELKKNGGGLELRRGPIPYVTAIENVRHSGGMLRIATDEPKTGATVAIALEDMPTEQLKMMMLTAGVSPTKKQMSRDDIITSIRTKLAALEVTDSEE